MAKAKTMSILALIGTVESMQRATTDRDAMYKKVCKQAARVFEDIRADLGMTQAEFADKLDLGSSMLSKIECGVVNPSHKAIIDAFVLWQDRTKEPCG